MMPRKRKTTVGESSSQPKPVIPEGEEGNQLTKEQRIEKIDLLLADFDMQVKARIEVIKIRGESVLKEMNKAYRMELVKTPKDVKAMTVVDYLKIGGQFEVNQAADASTIFQNIVGNSTLSKKTASRTVAAPLEAISENEENEQQNIVQGTVKRGRRKAVVAPSATTERRTTRGAAKNAFETPGMNWATPLVTPKFDYRLPMTPFVRNPKVGEQTVTLSVATGSPLSARPITNCGEPEIVVPLGNDNVLVVNRNTDLASLDEDTRAKIAEAHRKLAGIIDYQNLQAKNL